jgi:hypothetical protein
MLTIRANRSMKPAEVNKRTPGPPRRRNARARSGHEAGRCFLKNSATVALKSR